MQRLGLVSTWYDGEIAAGENVDRTIEAEPLSADIILCLLSPEYLANEYIWRRELLLGAQYGKIVIPVTMVSCDFKDAFRNALGKEVMGFLTKKQFNANQKRTSANDFVWIAAEPSKARRHEYYHFIVAQIKKHYF